MVLPSTISASIRVDMYLLALALGRPIHAEATCPATGTRSG